MRFLISVVVVFFGGFVSILPVTASDAFNRLYAK
jgi:hypothetical protein